MLESNHRGETREKPRYPGGPNDATGQSQRSVPASDEMLPHENGNGRRRNRTRDMNVFSLDHPDQHWELDQGVKDPVAFALRAAEERPND